MFISKYVTRYYNCNYVEILNEACRPDLIDPVLDFLTILGTLSITTTNSDVIQQTVRDILVEVKGMPKHEVCMYGADYYN